MNALFTLDAVFCLHFALTLLHFLWQGLLLAMLAGLAGWCLHNRSAAVRYRVYSGSLIMMLACLPVTFVVIHDQDETRITDVTLSTLMSSETSADCIPDIPTKITDVEAPYIPVPIADEAGELLSIPMPHSENAVRESTNPMPVEAATVSIRERATRWTLTGYVLGVCAMLARMLLGFTGTHRLRHDALELTDMTVVEMIRRRTREFGLRHVPTIAYCHRVAVPALIGIWRPTILLPTALATGLTPEQLELVVLHELAHIQRWDNAWLVAQRIAEAFLFFHPAVWYVSRRMSIERELCCDEMVVPLASHPSKYAESLLRVVELTTDIQTSVPATATMASPRDGSALLVHRLMRILGQPEKSPVRLPRLWPTLTIALLLVATISLVHLNASEEPDKVAPTESPNLPVAQVPQRELSFSYTLPSSLSAPCAPLPHGGFIELLGLGEYPRTDTPAWAPDGTSLGKSLPSEEGTEPHTTTDFEGKLARVFRFRVTALKKLNLTCSICGVPNAPSRHLEVGGEMLAKPHIWDVALPIAPEMQSAQVLIAASGEWDHYASGNLAKDTEDVQLCTPILRKHMATRQFRAVIVNGQDRESVASPQFGTSLDAVVPASFSFRKLKCNQVKETRIESREHTTVGFSQVSLQPGHATQPGHTTRVVCLVSSESMSSSQIRIRYLEAALHARQLELDHLLETVDDHPGAPPTREIVECRRLKDAAAERLSIAHEFAVRLHADEVRHPLSSQLSIDKDVSASGKSLARLIAAHELGQHHAEAFEGQGNEAWLKQKLAMFASFVDPDDLGVKWNAQFYNPARENSPKLDLIETRILAELPHDKDEVFLRSSGGPMRYLQRIRVRNVCLNACHTTKRGVFLDLSPDSVKATDRLNPNEVLAVIGLDIEFNSTNPPKLSMEAAYPASVSTPADDKEDAQQVSVPHGNCRDQDGNPISGADIRLYLVDWHTKFPRLIEKTTSDPQGRFRFVPHELDERDGYLQLTIKAKGFASVSRSCSLQRWLAKRKGPEIALRKPYILKGRVLDHDGKPVEGAVVRLGNSPAEKAAGLQTTVSDPNGHYAIDDLDATPFIGADRRSVRLADGRVYCEHPDYAYTWADPFLPDEVDFRLAPSAQIEGRVIYAESGKPASGVTVYCRGNDADITRSVTTDEQGRYRIGNLASEPQNLWLESDEWTATAVESVEPLAGQTQKAPELKLIRGATITGRLVHGVTGRPLTMDDFREFGRSHGKGHFNGRGLYFIGPSRPRTHDDPYVVKLTEDGTYFLRVPPGETTLSFMPKTPWRFVGYPDGLNKTFALEEGKDTRFDLWIVYQPEPEIF